MLKRLSRIVLGGIRLPRVCLSVIRWIYKSLSFIVEVFRQLVAVWIVAPIVQAIAVDFGKHISIERIPYIWGKGKLSIGDNVRISGKISIAYSRRPNVVPELIIGKNVFIGHGSAFMLASSITIGDYCLIGGGVRIQDNDGHPLDPELRKRREKVSDKNIAAVVLGENVWVGARATILKGVTIGDNAVIGTGSIVTKDVAAGAVVAGNPARVIRGRGDV